MTRGTVSNVARICRPAKMQRVILLWTAPGSVPAMAEVASGGSTIDYVAMVDPYLMSACGRWFFFRMGKGPFGMVKLFPDTKNAGLAAVRVNRRFADAFDHDFTEISYVYWRDAKEA